MKSLTAFIVLAALVTLAASSADDWNYDRVNSKACAEELKIDLEKVDEKNFGCLMKCVLEKEGVLAGGQIDGNKGAAVVDAEENISDSDKAKIKAAIPSCIEEATSSDDCEKSAQFAGCIHKSLN